MQVINESAEGEEMAHIYFENLPGGGCGFGTRISLALNTSNAARLLLERPPKLTRRGEKKKKKIADASLSQLDVGDRLNTPFSLRGSIIKAVKMTLVSAQGGMFCCFNIVIFGGG